MGRKTTKKYSRLLLSGILLLALALGCVRPAWAATADELEESLLGELSAHYESNGDPGCISDGSDAGGKSYGMYMLASNAGTPWRFFQWCKASSDAYYQYVGVALDAAYYAGGAGYGAKFDATWRRLAQEDPTAFAHVQWDFIRTDFYVASLRKIEEAAPDFDISRYSIALRNVIWSRAVQHGVGYYSSPEDKSSAVGLIVAAMNDLGTYTPQEADLIDAIYARSGAVTDDGYYVMYGETAMRYGVAGKALVYFSGNSCGIQLGVYKRLRYDEPAAAHLMLAQYGGEDTADTNVLNGMGVYAGSYPTYECQLSPGNSYFNFGGILRGPYPITSVTAAILYSDGSSFCSHTDYPDARYYDLSQLDSYMLYSRLPAGEYMTSIIAKDSAGNYFSDSIPFRVGAQDGVWVRIDGEWYYEKGDGSYATGWYMISGDWYYFDDEGVMQTGWLLYNGVQYYLKSSGAMAVGWQLIDGTWYYFGSGGAMKTGWQLIGGKWYYFDSSGAMQTGWLTIGGKEYYLLPSGAMAVGLVRVGDDWCYFDENGCLTETYHEPAGWLEIRGEWYYFDESHNMQTGWLTLDGKIYYFNGQGVMQTGWQTIDGSRYFFGDDGAARTGWLEIDGARYYFHDDGAMAVGWLTLDGKIYYFGDEGVMQTGWQTIDGSRYLFGDDGAARIGWLESDGTWYFFDDDGAMRIGWLFYNGVQYYMKSSGAMATGWITIDGDWYYFNNGGGMKTGWLLYNGVWYYLKGDGVMATGWHQIGGVWYYFNGGGAMKTGWLLYGGDWYYLKGSGAMATGWHQIGGAWYYFYSSGVMAHDCWIGNYHVNSDGRWDNP
jgi:glucan-binding YG repeat protein